jgi:SAM-dependent methyltransferase
MSADRSIPHRLRVWDRPAAQLAKPSSARPGVLEPSGLLVQGPHNAGEFAARLYAAEAMHPPRSSLKRLEGAEPFSLQWFLNIEKLRHSRPGSWIPRLLEFNKHAGETLLCLGHGLGTDWLQYARHGAQVVVCSPSSLHLSMARRNFELRGLPGGFLHASPASLPLDTGSIDVACVMNLLEITQDPQAVVEEVYRVLKPGGKVLAVTPAWYDVDFWDRAIFPWKCWLPGRKKAADPITRYSGASLGRMFGRFVEQRTHKRHLRRSFVPHIWRWLPLPMLERLMGRFLVFKAFKPLSAALPAAAPALAA